MKKFILTVLVAAVLTLILTSPTSAATPPDSCFAFNTGTGTITNYYAHEANNPANPACTRDVDIPSTINGVAVTTIGTAANYWNATSATSFANKSLISVTIPSGVTSIGNFAFYGNQLISAIIPSGVTNIGDFAFSRNQLTTATIPNSVTNLGAGAFDNNNLQFVELSDNLSTIRNRTFSNNYIETLDIPSSLIAIGDLAFAFNKISEVLLPNSVSAINSTSFSGQNPNGKNINSTYDPDPDIWDNFGAPLEDPGLVQQAYNTIWYVNVYTSESSIPAGLMNGVMSEFYWTSGDGNENGKDDSLGGHIINPASAELKYVNATNANLQSSQTFNGVLNGSYLNNYRVTQGPEIPMPADPENPTPTEQAAIDEALSAYYRIGDSVTITPPAIDGYITPPTQTFVLGAADNEFSYVYSTEDSDTGTPTTPGGTGAGTDADVAQDSDGSLAETGMNLGLIATTSSLMIILGTIYLIRNNIKQKGMKL